MHKAKFTEEPARIAYFSQPDGSAEVWLRKNIEEVTEGEETYWQADEVNFNTRLSQEEVLTQADNYFIEEPETTIADIVEGMEILTNLILEG